MRSLPPRTATDEYFAAFGHRRRLAVSFDVDLGELVEGRRVVARGVELAEHGGLLHYEFVPGAQGGMRELVGIQQWSVRVAGGEDISGGAFGSAGGAASHGERDLGVIEPGAATLVLEFEPVPGWTPAEPWVRELVIDLVGGTAAARYSPG